MTLTQINIDEENNNKLKLVAMMHNITKLELVKRIIENYCNTVDITELQKQIDEGSDETSDNDGFNSGIV